LLALSVIYCGYDLHDGGKWPANEKCFPELANQIYE
jgi:hypothetical protein